MRRRLQTVASAGVLLALAAGPAACAEAAATPKPRTVHITIRFSTFDPGDVQVEPGETVRFVVENTDPIDHEFILGGRFVQLVHERGTEAHHPPRPGEISVPAGQIVSTTYPFPDAPGELIFGCHLPGHYAYGMHGIVAIG
jgi:uncharacterized cupredoxin-like copper-binding protein